MHSLIQQRSFSPAGAMIFRTALFGAAASLAVYILYKLATTLHATDGFYAYLFPFSSLLAAAGMTLALKPQMSCDCSIPMRSGFGAVAILWLVTGTLCGPSIVEMAGHSPMSAMYVGSLMITQHIFLSSVILAFAFAPEWMMHKLGVAGTGSAPAVSSKASL